MATDAARAGGEMRFVLMRRGVPLTDEDRPPWLEFLRRAVAAACGRGEGMLLACSALKRVYRDSLAWGVLGCVEYIDLRGPEGLIRQRLAARKGHFMKPELLDSQFAALKPPDNALPVEVAPSPEVVAADIQSRLGLRRTAGNG